MTSIPLFKERLGFIFKSSGDWTDDRGTNESSHLGNESWEAIVSEATRRITTASRVEVQQALMYLVAIVALFVISRKFVNARYHLQEFAGPWWAAYTRLWLSKTIASADSARIFVDVNKKYGSLARVGPNHLLTSDPEVTRRILAVGSKWRRGPWFDSIRLDPLVANIVSERDPHKHNAMRRKMSAGYAGKDIEGLEEVVDERIGEFISSLAKRALSLPGQTRSYDIAKRVQFFTIDTITHVCFGRPMGFVEADDDKSEFIAIIESRLPIVLHFSVFLFLNSILRSVASITSLRKAVVPSSADKSGIGVVMGVS